MSERAREARRFQFVDDLARVLARRRNRSFARALASAVTMLCLLRFFRFSFPFVGCGSPGFTLSLLGTLLGGSFTGLLCKDGPAQALVAAWGAYVDAAIVPAIPAMADHAALLQSLLGVEADYRTYAAPLLIFWPPFFKPSAPCKCAAGEKETVPRPPGTPSTSSSTRQRSTATRASRSATSPTTRPASFSLLFFFSCPTQSCGWRRIVRAQSALNKCVTCDAAFRSLARLGRRQYVERSRPRRVARDQERRGVCVRGGEGCARSV